ncbi:MAG: hypothetical protein L0287_27160 [Anaerolineae bacterium]|nr:hypothetical protein [Anaerolineae bacterium]MCI0607954.1 hypothetical protein [Anaerolineae bacterium]
MNNQNYVIEWAPFRLKEGADEAAFLSASEDLQRDFLNQQQGFVRRELVRAGNEQWADVVYWASRADAEEAVKHAMDYPACLRYFEMLSGADPDHPELDILHLNVIKSYS